MKIRRYTGKDAQEAILKVKMDLGNDALIFNTRKVRQKGLFKIFSKPLVEVLAALDEDYDKKKEDPKSLDKQQQAATGDKPRVNLQTVEEKNEKILELENKMNNLETMLRKLSEQTPPADENSL